jgi:hypothetical protein
MHGDCQVWGGWLSELGPVKASKAREPVDAIDSGVGGYTGRRQGARDTIANLKRDLAQSDDELVKARARIAELLDHGANRKGTGGT